MTKPKPAQPVLDLPALAKIVDALRADPRHFRAEVEQRRREFPEEFAHD
jgi:hypothetical protein